MGQVDQETLALAVKKFDEFERRMNDAKLFAKASVTLSECSLDSVEWAPNSSGRWSLYLIPHNGVTNRLHPNELPMSTRELVAQNLLGLVRAVKAAMATDIFLREKFVREVDAAINEIGLAGVPNDDSLGESM